CGDVGWESSPNADLYDPAAGTFSATSNLTTPRSDQTATLLPNGNVLITGGDVLNPALGSFSICEPFVRCTNAGAEVYDPSSGTFSWIGNMTGRREGHTATLLNDGRVLITGGVAYTNRFAAPPPANPPPVTLSSAELYAPQVLVPAPVLFSVSGDGQ